MRILYKFIICAVICMSSSATLEAQTLINYQQQKRKKLQKSKGLKSKDMNPLAKRELLKHFKSILNYIQREICS